MKKIIFLITVFIFTTQSFVQGQYRYPNKDDQATAKKLKSKYSEDDKICALKSSERYTFDIGKPEKNEAPPLTATMEQEEEIIAISDNINYVFAQFYNTFSSVYRFRVWYKADKNYKLSDNYNDATLADYSYSMNGIFANDARYKSFKYSFSGLGDLMKFSFIKNYSDVRYLTSVYFNNDYPVEEKTITFEVPDWLTVDFKEINFEGFDIEKSKSYNLNKKLTTYKYVMRGCSSISVDDNAPHVASNWPHVIVLAKEYEVKGSKYQAFKSVDDLYGWYNKLVSQVKNNESELKPKVTKLTDGKKDDLEKIKSIYYWVQDNIRYIAFESGLAGFQPASADHVYKNKYGDCKGMANLLATMLKIAGYDARLAWIGTKDIPYDYSIPSLCVDNHMICAVNLKDSLYFLDATETYISFGDYADRIQGKQTLVQNGKSYLLKYVPSFDKEHNKVLTKYIIQLNNESLKGSKEATYNGESKTDILRGYNRMATTNREDALNRFLSRNDKNITISNISSSDLSNRETPVNFKFDFEASNKVTTADKEVYIILELDHPYSGITVKEDRKQDYVFDEKVLNICETEFTIPAGYTLKYLPDPVKEIHTGYSLIIQYEKKGNKIIYKRTLSFDNGVIRKNQMKDFYSFVKKMKQAYSDQIILAKN